MPRVAAVVVTFNRKDLLRVGLQALLAQDRAVDEIIVIDNLSTDGTDLMMTGELAYPSVTYVRLEENIGGAGGFYEGTKRAYEKGHDWVWLMDDDTAPKPDALSQLLAASDRVAPDTVGFLCSHVVWTDGAPHQMNIPLPTKGDAIRTIEGDLISVSRATFVSAMFSRPAITKVGFPLRDLFIYGDDTEYCERVSRVFPCYYVTGSVAVHMTKFNLGPDLREVGSEQLWKYFYAHRNSIYRARQFGPKRVLKHCLIDFPRAIGNALARKEGRGKAVSALVRGMFAGWAFSPKVEMPCQSTDTPS